MFILLNAYVHNVLRLIF